jgi:hypothetical protein
MCNVFANIAKEASMNEKTTGIVRKHMVDMEGELRAFEVKNSKKYKTTVAQDTTRKVK